MKIREQARKYFSEGKYNCCQAVICACCHECGIDDDEIFRLAEGFGAGMAIKDVCGAATGMFMAIGLHSSAGNKSDPRKTKMQTYEDVRNAAADFEAECGSLYCRDLKESVDGKQRTSCDKCVEFAAEYVEKYIEMHK